MASREELNNQKQFNKEQERQLTATQQIVDYTRTLNDDSRELLGLSTKRTTAEKQLASLLNSSATTLSKQLKDYKNITDVQTDIAKNAENSARMEKEAGIILDGRVKDVKDAVEASRLARDLEKEIKSLGEGASEAKKEQARLATEAADALMSNVTEAEKLAFNTLETSQELQQQNRVLKSQEQGFKNLNKAGGVLEGTMQGIGGVLKQFGLGDLADKMGFDDIESHMDTFKKDMLAVTDEFGNTTYRAATFGDTVKIGTERVKQMGTAFANAIPLMIVGKLVQTLNAASEEQKKIRNLSGQNATQISAANMNLLSSIDYLKTIGALSKELGINVDAAFSKETLTEAAELTQQMGLSAEATAKMALRTQAAGQDMKKNTAQAFKTTKEFIKTNKSAVNIGQVMEDVGNVSSAVSLSMGDSTKALTAAAAQARSMGMSLRDMEGIADNLLNIESSLEAEMEAELLTGKSLNLERARSAALMNDMETLGKEIAGNQEILNAFQSGNRMEQQAIAKSLGMSTDQVADMIYQQKLSAGMSEEQAAKAAGISEEEAKRMSAQEQLNKSLEKMASLLVPILSKITALMSNTLMFKVILGVAAVSILPKIVSGVGAITSGFKEGVGIVKQLIPSLGKLQDKISGSKLGQKIKGMFGGGGAKDAVPSGVDKVGDVAKDTKSITAGQGGGTKAFLTDLAAGLKEMGAGQVFAGIGAMALAGPAFILALPSIPFLLFMGLTPLNLLKQNFTGLAAGLNKMSTTFVGIGAVALAGPALALGTLAIPFLGFMAIPGLGIALQTNFTALSTGLTTFGNPATATNALIGIGLMGALGTAMIPFAYALSLLTPVIEAFGDVVVNVMSAFPPIIQAVADGFVTMFKGITPKNVASMALLGPALLSASVGLGAFGIAMAGSSFAAFFGGGILDDLEDFAELGPKIGQLGTGLSQTTQFLNKIGTLSSPLFMTSAAIRSIADSLSAMRSAGFLAMPVIGRLLALSNAGPGLLLASKLLGSFSEKDEDKDKDLKLETMINEMRDMKLILNKLLDKDTAVYIDGERIDEAIQVGSKLD